MSLVQINDYTRLKADDAPQRVITELMRLYYSQGWVSGTGGGISIRTKGNIYIAPSGVHKERLQEDDIYVIDENNPEIIIYNPNEFGKNYKISACHPLFCLAYKYGNAGAVIHSHSMHAYAATLLFEGKDEFRITHCEMIKGIKGMGYYDTLVVPIIENTALEHELADSMEAALKKYPNTFAVLVRRHGVYIWGKDWVECKTHAECYHYLFEAALKMKQLGIDPSAKPSQ